MAEHFLRVDDLTEDLERLLSWGESLKNDSDSGDFLPLMDMTVASIYEKPSTRTRISFEVGVRQLGGHPMALGANEMQLGHKESIADTANVLSRYVQGITHRGFGHSDVTELAESSDVPVINALSDDHHPCQAIADMMTVREFAPEVDRQKIAWVGDGNNVLHDLMLAAAILGDDVVYATPDGHEPLLSIVNDAEAFAAESGGSVTRASSAEEAVEDATVIYTDVFLSMGQEDDKNKLQDFEGYSVTKELCSGADEDHIFLHCLPANRGVEVSDEVMDGPNSRVWDQAENRLHAQKSLLARLLNDAAWDTYGEVMGVEGW